MINNKKVLLAGDKNTSKKVLDELAESKNDIVRATVAYNPNTAVKTLKKLIEDDIFVKQHVAVNPNLKISIIKRLYQDNDEDIRALIALNNNTPGHILEKLANDP